MHIRLGRSQRQANPLVRGSFLSPFLTFSRAQTTGVATALNSDGFTWREVAADVPRYHDIAQGLLLEVTQTNLVNNPRAEGRTLGTIGAGGVLPTGWSIDAAAGLSTDVVSTGTMRGLPYADIRIYGTSSATFYVLRFWTPVAAVAAQVWTLQVPMAIIAGTRTNITSIVASLRPSGGSFVPADSADFGAMSASAWTNQPVTGTAGVGVVTAAGGIVVYMNTASAIDITVRVGPAMLVNAGSSAAVISTLTLPIAASPTTSVRGTDHLRAPLATLGIAPTGACTLLLRLIMPTTLLPGWVMSVDDGTEVNRLSIITLTAASALRLSRIIAGVGAGLDIGAQPVGTPFSLGICIDGTGRIAGSINGAAAVGLTGGPTSGLTTLRIGTNSSLAIALNGSVLQSGVLPYPVSDAELAARTAAFV